jgi:hypothetical protein
MLVGMLESTPSIIMTTNMNGQVLLCNEIGIVSLWANGMV